MSRKLVGAAVLLAGLLLNRQTPAIPVGDSSCRGRMVELFSENFSKYPRNEVLDLKRFGQRLGPWQLMTQHFSWHSPRYDRRQMALPFRIIELDGQCFLTQPESFSNVVIKAGRPQWRDYVLELDVAVEDGPAGPIVRYVTSRQNYWVCFQSGQPVKLYRRDQDVHEVLGICETCRIERNRLYRCRVVCDGPRLAVSVDGRQLMVVEDKAYSQGQIALRTDGPCRFGSVKVFTSPQEAERIAAEISAIEARATAAMKKMPPTRLIHSVVVPGNPAHMRVLDVNDDGVPEIIASYAPEAGRSREAGRLAVFDWNGNRMWTLEPSAVAEGWRTFAVFLNYGDIDADGSTELIVVRGPEILIVDGATGRVERVSPVPNDRRSNKPAILHGCLVCNLRGLPCARDLIFKDEYTHLWAYTDELRPLWDRALNIGHYPRACDLDGDGKDEVMAGYSLLAADGRTLWTVPGADPEKNVYPGSEHADAILIERFGGPEAPWRIALAASDFGFVLLDSRGQVVAHHRIGHAQWLSAARFRPQRPDRQIVVGTAWGNHNIIHLFDGDGKLLMLREMNFGPPIPVYWLGTESPLFTVPSWAAGLFNGDLDRVLRATGEVVVPPFACDVNADGVDELLAREGNKLLVYAPQGIQAVFKPPPANRPNWFVPGANSHCR